MTRTTTRPAAAAAICAVLAAVLLTACGGSGGGTSSSAGGAASGSVRGEASPGQPQTGKAAGLAGGGAQGSQGSQAADVAVLEQRIVRTGDLALQAQDVPAVTARVHTIVDTADGFVADERSTSSNDPGNPEPATGPDRAAQPVITQSVLTVRVPNASLDRVMQQVGALGTLVSRSQTSEDVTTQYVDTASRVASQTASVARVRALLAQATNLGQIVQIEGELARREADLESLQAQLKALQDKTVLSTLTITVTAPAVAVKQPRRGFLGGLQAGWSALAASVGVLLTLLGTLLPFVLVLALLAWPLLWWLRRQRRRALPQPQPAP